tara:strand:- start:266 stop:799 length:534 start_codon:yes stop_codon:yes gene_type:complete
MTENEQETTAELNILDGEDLNQVIGIINSRFERGITQFETKEEDWAWDEGRFHEFRRTNGIKTAQWSCTRVNDRPFSIGMRRWHDPIDGDLIGPITIKTLAMFIDGDAMDETGELKLVNEWIERPAKNNTIGEIIKGFDDLLNSHFWCEESGYAKTNHYFIEEIEIKGDVVTVWTGS